MAHPEQVQRAIQGFSSALHPKMQISMVVNTSDCRGDRIRAIPKTLEREMDRWCDCCLQIHRHGEDTAEKPHFLMTRQEWD